MLRRAFVLFVVSLLGVVAACRPETPQGMPGGLGGAPVPPFEGTPPEDPYVFEGTPGTYGGTITFSTISDPKSWNPVTSSETSTTYITSGPLYYPLLGQDNQKQEINNGLCSSYESTPDHLVWTFHLRKGVRWSDGEPFTAADVKFTFDCAFEHRGRDLDRRPRPRQVLRSSRSSSTSPGRRCCRRKRCNSCSPSSPRQARGSGTGR